MKLKALGLAVLAALAVSAVAVMNASATAGGHFISDAEGGQTTIHGEDSATDQTQFTGTSTIECDTATYHGNTDEATETEIDITPTYSECSSSVGGGAEVTMNGCTYKFTVRSEPDKNHNTVHLECPSATQGPEIHVSNGCTITIEPNQTPSGGIVYKTGETEGKHDITAEVTASNIAAIYHGGLLKCGTGNGNTLTSTMHGTATMWGTDSFGNKVNVTAT